MTGFNKEKDRENVEWSNTYFCIKNKVRKSNHG